MTVGEPHPQRCNPCCEHLISDLVDALTQRSFIDSDGDYHAPGLSHEEIWEIIEAHRSRSHSSAGPVPNCNPPQEGKFCDYQGSCARTSSATCEYCDEAYSNKWKQHDAEVARAVLDCSTCKYFPAGSIFDENCPQAYPLPYKWDVPIDIWEEITRRIGCSMHSSIQQKPDRIEKLLESLRSGEGVQHG